jgi:hypothetical protein
LGGRGFAGGPCRLYRKRVQERWGAVFGLVVKGAYADILLDISSEPGYTRAMMAVKVYFYFFSRHP